MPICVKYCQHANMCQILSACQHVQNIVSMPICVKCYLYANMFKIYCQYVNYVTLCQQFLWSRLTCWLTRAAVCWQLERRTYTDWRYAHSHCRHQRSFTQRDTPATPASPQCPVSSTPAVTAVGLHRYIGTEESGTKYNTATGQRQYTALFWCTLYLHCNLFSQVRSWIVSR